MNDFVKHVKKENIQEYDSPHELDQCVGKKSFESSKGTNII